MSAVVIATLCVDMCVCVLYLGGGGGGIWEYVMVKTCNELSPPMLVLSDDYVVQGHRNCQWKTCLCVSGAESLYRL